MQTSGLRREGGGDAKRARPTPQQMAIAARMKKPKEPTPETGFVDLAAADYVLDSTGSITLLATVPQGSSVNQRVGKKATWRSAQFRGTVVAGTTTTVADGAVIIVYDREPGAALPAITDILVTATPQSLNNDANSYRFKIVRRWDYTLLGNVTAPATGREAYDFTEFVNLKGLDVIFKAAGTGVIADIQKGALYLVTVGNVAAGTAAAKLNTGVRVRFLDT